LVSLSAAGDQALSKLERQQKQPTQKSVAKKRTGQEDVDFDCLFANFFQQHEQEWQINLGPGRPFGVP
jgi:hypothetical protein